MFQLRVILRKCGQSAPILAPIAVISGHYWRRRNDGQNEANEWTNTRLYPKFTLRNARLNGTEVRDHYDDWQRSVVAIKWLQKSGFVVHNGEYVVTTAMTTQDMTSVSLVLSTTRLASELFTTSPLNSMARVAELDGQVVYAEPSVGLALIKVRELRRGALTALPLADQTHAGQQVVVLGSASGKNGCSFVMGSVTSLDGPPAHLPFILNPDRQYIGHSIKSVPNFNGGPVLDMNGRVVGVMLCGVDEHQQHQHILPAKDLRAFIQRGVEYERKDRKNRYSFEDKSRLGVVLKFDDKGFHVLKFTDNNPINTSRALRVGDRITHINGIPFQTLSQLTDTLDRRPVGQIIHLTVDRGYSEVLVSVISRSLDCAIV